MVSVDSTTNAPHLQLAKTTNPTTNPTQPTQTSGGCTDSTADEAQSWTTDSFSNMTLTTIVLYASTGSSGAVLHIKSDNSNTPGTDLVTASIPGNSGGTGTITTSISTPLSASTKYWIYVHSLAPSGGCSGNGFFWGTDTANPYAGGNYWTQVSGNISGTDAAFSVGYVTPIFTTSGNFTSQTFNVGFPTASWLWSWGLFNTSETDNGQTISYQTQSSNDGVTFDAAVTATPGPLSPPPQNRLFATSPHSAGQHRKARSSTACL